MAESLAALEAVLPTIRIGMTERELSSALTMQLLKAGSDSELPFAPIVCAGPNSANPHAIPSERKIERGDGRTTILQFEQKVMPAV